MHDTADLRERLVQLQMSCRVGRGIQIPFHLIAVQIHDYHHLRCQLVIIHTTGLITNSPLSLSMALTFPQVKSPDHTGADPYLLHILSVLIPLTYT